jgi:hypothetical protein
MPLPKGLHDGFSVYTQEETRLVRATATLFDLDLQPSLRPLRLDATRTLSRLIVPVFEGEKQVGAGTIFSTGNKVMALISFDFETPERFDLSLGRTVYAIPRGDYYLDATPEEAYTVDYIDISGIDLSTVPSTEEGRGSPLIMTRYSHIGE